MNMFKPDKLQVFILGAGFSRSFCRSMPLMRDLADSFFEDKSREAYPELYDYIRETYRNGNNYDGIKDIETIATVILSKKIFCDDMEKYNFEKLRYQLLKFIRDKYYSFAADRDKENILREFITSVRSVKISQGSMSRKARRIFISFNYDLLIERLGVQVDYGFLDSYAKFKPIRNYLHGSKSIEYIKLHGSFNWFKAKGTDDFDINKVYVVNENDVHYNIHSRDIPVFIPMAHAKDAFLRGSLFSTLWADAISKLEEAEDIYFIGYGFPQSDVNNLFLFLKLNKFKEKLRKIVVLDESDDQEDLKRLEGIFGADIVENNDASAFIEKELI